MALKTWTVDEMLAEHPCSTYTRKRIAELWAGRERLSAADFLTLPIPDADKVWACLHDPAVAALATPRIVERVVRAHALCCGVPAVEQWAARAVSWSAPAVAVAGEAAAWIASEEDPSAASEEAERKAQLDDIRAAIQQEVGHNA